MARKGKSGGASAENAGVTTETEQVTEQVVTTPVEESSSSTKEESTVQSAPAARALSSTKEDKAKERQDAAVAFVQGLDGEKVRLIRQALGSATQLGEISTDRNYPTVEQKIQRAHSLLFP